tara:strand:+ start:167 stop:763 length:597 start_codon:yes stop_codon:yes gene_type:complete
VDSNYKIGGRRSIQQFNNNFFYKYRAVNAEKFIEEVEACTSKWIDNTAFTWGNHCDSDKVPLKLRDFEYLMKPNIDMLIDEIGSDITPKYSDPWINMYTRGQYQEIHDHHGVDFASVFFANDGEDFAKFYFYNRNSIDMPFGLRKIFKTGERFEVNIKAGDIIFFPSHMLHGVSPHNSDVVRKTFAVNFDLNNNETNS